MAPRDYKNRRPAKKRARGPSKEAPKSKFKLGLFMLLTFGAIAGGVYFLQQIDGSAEKHQKRIANTQPAATIRAKDLPAKPKEDYTYINELPKQEVPVDVPTKEFSTTPYIMQCGSFRNKDDAERMKLNIALNSGHHSEVDRTEGENGVWYRVRLGPFLGDEATNLTPKRQAQSIQREIRKLKISTCRFWVYKG